MKDIYFGLLIRKRIKNVLLISSKYDAFLIEQDGRIDEQIFNEYVSLNLRYPPSFLLAHTSKETFKILSEDSIDLVIIMLGVGNKEVFEIAREIKQENIDLPIVLLTNFSKELIEKIDSGYLSTIDYIFSWLGNADILMAIIKLIEDKMNLVHDVEEIGVQVILFVEDSIRYYSSYLPHVYKIIFVQSKRFMQEGLNDHEKMLRMRGRPKILHATNYEDANRIYDKYKNSLLGIISDIEFSRSGKIDKDAGIRFCRKVKEDDKFMPVILQSSDKSYEEIARKLGAGFIYKYSKNLSIDIRNYLIRELAFGDFVFYDPDSMLEIARANNLHSFQQIIAKIPARSIEYHSSNNHFSKWLNARALFYISSVFKILSKSDFQDAEEIREYMLDTISLFRKTKGRGVIAKFNKRYFDEYQIFSRIGNGSLGGKARGLAFIDSIITKNKLSDKFEGVNITIPQTVVLCSDIFDNFMESNNLYEIAYSGISDEQILKCFVDAKLPGRVHQDLYAFISVVKNPIAVRSSSLLEDSHYQPFAGVYSTYMLPFIETDSKLMIRILSDAIKCVYASVFFKSSRSYVSATTNVIDEEKMSIILQEVCGNKYGNRFYPSFSGVARSLNFYPIEPETSDDGIANIALGLGKTIVEGGTSIRFSPKFPQKVLQLSSPEMTLKSTQKNFYALNLDQSSFKASTDDGVNLLKLRIKEAEKDKSLKDIASTYDFQNGIIREGTIYEGKKLITFSNILKHNVFPLAEILQTLLKIGEQEMNCPIEIEFAVNLDTPKGKPRIFNFLQIRPIVENEEIIDCDIENIPDVNKIIHSNSALGNGKISDLCDLVYVKPESFEASKSEKIVEHIEKINDRFIKENKNYILVGPGRWGSSDHWLGIPVKWSQISKAKLIVESGLQNYRIDPSQGTHFFQNITSFRIGYFTINPYINDGIYDLDFLSNIKAKFEDEFIRHIRFSTPLNVIIDGKKNMGIVMKPEK
ncbi:MAG: phosphoenolpyruvate synthase [Bacteroidetes bacterium]|nr:phosphoenolpyruvate synthase [Bacteroidota bacterium]MBT6835533.1 phosphoenolpyruvate synthase [Bacteroidota bacterium]MBT7144866.1 phosphoenolpyruvate synthase [Bacteroidota bacterium]MBT7492461.1 phosphoenolpyruvate synthase [Bacteroidota bacterium]